jgi:hypothetical protein
MTASLPPTFLADLARVYATLRPPALSARFLADLKKVYDTLPTASDENLRLLGSRFDKWRTMTRELLRTHLRELDKDDPLLCPISLFRTMDAGRLEIAHTQTLAWLLHPEREHGFGKALLAALLGHLAEHDHFDRLDVVGVVPEYILDGPASKGRLDVLAHGEWEIGGEQIPGCWSSRRRLMLGKVKNNSTSMTNGSHRTPRAGRRTAFF